MRAIVAGRVTGSGGRVFPSHATFNNAVAFVSHMASKRSIATRTAARTSSIQDSGISFTARANFKRFGTGGNVTGRGDRSRTLHHRSADGYGR